MINYKFGILNYYITTRNTLVTQGKDIVATVNTKEIIN